MGRFMVQLSGLHSAWMCWLAVQCLVFPKLVLSSGEAHSGGGGSPMGRTMCVEDTAVGCTDRDSGCNTVQIGDAETVTSVVVMASSVTKRHGALLHVAAHNGYCSDVNINAPGVWLSLSSLPKTSFLPFCFASWDGMFCAKIFQVLHLGPSLTPGDDCWMRACMKRMFLIFCTSSDPRLNSV